MKSPYQEFLDDVRERGIENVLGRYYSSYRGFCADVNDPEVLGRIKVRCPAVWGDEVPDLWAWPVGQPAGVGHGTFWVPVKDEPVYVRFEGGDPAFPLWEHGWYAQGAAPAGAAPAVRILQSPAGLRIELNDPKGEAVITNAQGYRIEVSPAGIRLLRGGRTVGAMLGDVLGAVEKLTVLTPLGESSPPVNLGAFVALAQEFKTVLG
jgi:hypothetical protein